MFAKLGAREKSNRPQMLGNAREGRVATFFSVARGGVENLSAV